MPARHFLNFPAVRWHCFGWRSASALRLGYLLTIGFLHWGQVGFRTKFSAARLTDRNLEQEKSYSSRCSLFCTKEISGELFTRTVGGKRRNPRHLFDATRRAARRPLLAR